jgi:putative thioredoxin
MHLHHALHPDQPELIFDVEEANFDELVVARSQRLPVLVDIGADWCGPCVVLTPLLEKLIAECGGRLLLARVDADENMRIAGRHQVRGFPTVIAYSHGQEIDRFHSAKPLHFLREFAERIIARHAEDTSTA